MAGTGQGHATGSWKPLSKGLRDAVYQKSGGRCAYCGIEMSVTGKWSADHMIPRQRGGKDELENLVVCCPRCNSGKRNRSVDEYRALLSAHQAVNVKRIADRIRPYGQADGRMREALAALDSAVEILRSAEVRFYLDGEVEE